MKNGHRLPSKAERQRERERAGFSRCGFHQDRLVATTRFDIKYTIHQRDREPRVESKHNETERERWEGEREEEREGKKELRATLVTDDALKARTIDKIYRQKKEGKRLEEETICCALCVPHALLTRRHRPSCNSVGLDSVYFI